MAEQRFVRTLGGVDILSFGLVYDDEEGEIAIVDGETGDEVVVPLRIDTAEISANEKVAGDSEHPNNSKGPVIVDRTTGTKYRLFVDDGTLGIEAAE